MSSKQKLALVAPAVVSIHIARDRAAKMVRLRSAKLVAGHGIEGDRYFNKTGTFSKKKTEDKQVTLIEEEALLTAKRDYGADVKPGETRRNILVRGVALNHLVGKRFRVGEAVLEGIMLCEPCGHLAKLTSPTLREALVHRGGLRCRIVESGVVKPGDVVDVT
jgi:MOSC domain-containing protein YiiM